MDSRLRREIASSLDADPAILPYLPELFSDLEALGSLPEEVVDVLRPLGLPRDARVLDAGCGKGAIALRVALEFAVRVVGVDAFEPFIEHARARAGQVGVAERCEFRCADLREALSETGRFDVALLMGVGPVLGDQAATVGGLRRCVRPGGYIIIDDAYVAPGVQASDGLEAYVDHEETIRRLTSHGDELIREIARSAEDAARNDAAITAAIRRRAEVLARRHPENAALFEAYATAQERDSERMARDMVYALWVLRRP